MWLHDPPLVARLKLLALSAVAAALCACGAGGMQGAPPTPQDERVRVVQVPTEALEQAVLTKQPALRSDQVELAVAFPEGFAAGSVHPILVTQVTADSFRPNIAELSAYTSAALEQGFVVLTAQVMPWAEGERQETLLHRYVALRAALRWLAAEAPGSAEWPLVIAGFSGGAKISQALAFSLLGERRKVAGLFLGGCNEAHAGALLGEYPQLKPAFSQVAVFLSVGRDDRISTPAAVRTVAEELRGSGVQQLEVSVYPGGHRLDQQELTKALRWFRARLPS